MVRSLRAVLHHSWHWRAPWMATREVYALRFAHATARGIAAAFPNQCARQSRGAHHALFSKAGWREREGPSYPYVHSWMASTLVSFTHAAFPTENFILNPLHTPTHTFHHKLEI